MQMNTIVLNIGKYEKMLKELGMLKTENEELKKSLPASHNGDSAPVSTDAEKLAIAFKALEYVQSLASKVGENWGELVYVEFDIIGDALKEIQQ